MPNLNPKTDGKEYPIILINGPSGSGKTRAAATASSHYKLRPLEERKSLIELKDMLWISFDKDGIQSLQTQGLEPYYYDLSYMPVEGALWITNATTKLREARAFVAANNIKTVVIDTLSSINMYLNSFFAAANTTSNSQLAYLRATSAFQQLFLHVRGIPCNQIWLCHSRSAYVDPDQITEGQRAQREATTPGESKVDLWLSNAVREFIRPMPNLTVGLDADAKSGRRELVCHPDGVYYVKNRYDDLLLPREPVNLRAIFDKVETFEKFLRGTNV